MDRKSLSYDALKSVLGHMEANKRIQITIACPSLRNVEKAIPLEIDCLDFVHDYKVLINHKAYSFGLIRQYQEGNPPEPIQYANDRGGSWVDVDEWGFEKRTYRLVEAPGDINLGVQNEVDEDNDDERIRIEREIQELRDSGEENSYCFSHNEYKLLPYRCRDNNKKPPYDCFVQLNLQTGNLLQPSRAVQKVPYTKKLHEVMKGFMAFILGGRSCPVKVKCLEIYQNQQIVRLPVGVKFSVHELRVPTNIPIISEFLLPMLNKSCLPIKHIDQEIIVDLDDPFVANAEENTFRDCFNVNLFEFLLTLPHSKVNFFNKYYDYKEEEFIRFIENLMESDKTVGTTYQLGLGNDQKVKDTFSKIENGIMKRKVINDRKLIIQNNGSKEVQISYRKDVEFMFFGEIESFCVLKIEVLGNRQDTNDWLIQF